jgi:ferredoxin
VTTGPMRIVVDRGLCEGLGMCEAMAHEFFEVDDDDQMTLLEESPDEAHRSTVHAAVESCPVQALSLLG